jgi:glutamyl-tRNA synthetase
MSKPRVRFAPSPTGHIHIGNLRTAIDNWLFARNQGGVFLLRLEDTDRERSTSEAVHTVFQTLAWMGLDVDEEPVYQSRRLDRHLEVAEQLLERGLAYRDAKGRTEGQEAIVFRVGADDLCFDDLVHGPLRKPGEEGRDFVIVRSNGTPVFHLANVVDDVDMGITHVIRGDDHIDNTYRHAALYQALGAPLPRFAHLPMIVNAEGKPFSKRDGDAYVADYRRKGYLPDALLNFLALLGWSPGDDREFFPRPDLVESFSLERVRPAAAQMNLEKLRWLNGLHMERLEEEAYAAGFRTALAEGGIDWETEPELTSRVAALLRDRVKVFGEAPEQAAYFFSEEYPHDPQAVRKRLLKPDASSRLETVAARWAALEAFDAPSLEASLREASDGLGLSAGALIHPVRVAVSGVSRGPGLFELVEVLGRRRTLDRIRRAREKIDRGDWQSDRSGETVR